MTRKFVVTGGAGFIGSHIAEALVKRGDRVTVWVNGQEVNEFSMAVLEPDCDVTIKASSDSRIAVIGGETLSDRHLFWNFVSSRKERLEQAKDDWKNGRFPKVPGDEEEFIPLPE